MGKCLNGIDSNEFAEQWIIRCQRWIEIRNEILFPKIEKIIHDISPKIILDAGCGDGSSTETIIKCGIKEIYACDINLTLLDIAKQRFKNVNFLHIDLSKEFVLPLKFDLILCCSVFMFLDDTAINNSLVQFHNFINKGGYLLLSFVHPEWTLKANFRKNNDKNYFIDEQLNYCFPVSWENVRANLFYRPISWYINVLKENKYNIIDYNEVTIPEKLTSANERFLNEGGQKAFSLYLLKSEE